MFLDAVCSLVYSQHKSHEQRVDAVVAAAVRPSVVGTAVVAAEVAAITHPRPVMVGAAVATDIAIREAEMAAINRARYGAYPTTNVIVTVNSRLTRARHIAVTVLLGFFELTIVELVRHF